MNLKLAISNKTGHLKLAISITKLGIENWIKEQNYAYKTDYQNETKNPKLAFGEKKISIKNLLL